MTTKKGGSQSTAAAEVLELADQALANLDEALRRAHDVPGPDSRRDISAALLPLRGRLREVLLQLRTKVSGGPPDPRIRGSGG